MGASGQNDDDGLITGINVTPMVDVVLVLLIIFIVTASSLLKSSIPIELPRAASAEESRSGLMIVGIAQDGRLFINARTSALADIPVEVDAARKRLPAERRGKLNVFISADVGADYGRFAQVVDTLRLAGVSEISMDTRPVKMEEPAR